MVRESYDGSEINLDNIVVEPPRNGPTIWEIGIPDRCTSAEFFTPDPRPSLMTQLHLNKTHSDKIWGKRSVSRYEWCTLTR